MLFTCNKFERTGCQSKCINGFKPQHLCAQHYKSLPYGAILTMILTLQQSVGFHFVQLRSRLTSFIKDIKTTRFKLSTFDSKVASLA